jgi:hypothetical protein
MIKWGGDPESMIDISLCYNELYNLKKWKSKPSFAI